MSKNHVSQSSADLDAELDQYLKTKRVTPAVSASSGQGIDLFGSAPQKKKSLLQRLLTFLRTFKVATLQ